MRDERLRETQQGSVTGASGESGLGSNTTADDDDNCNYGGEERATAALKSPTPRLTKTAGDGDDGADKDATGERTKLIEHGRWQRRLHFCRTNSRLKSGAGDDQWIEAHWQTAKRRARSDSPPHRVGACDRPHSRHGFGSNQKTTARDRHEATTRTVQHDVTGCHNNGTTAWRQGSYGTETSLPGEAAAKVERTKSALMRGDTTAAAAQQQLWRWWQHGLHHYHHATVMRRLMRR